MATGSSRAPTLSAHDIDFFVANGFVRIDDAFPKDVAAEVRGILWHAMNLSPDEPAGWTSPVRKARPLQPRSRSAPPRARQGFVVRSISSSGRDDGARRARSGLSRCGSRRPQDPGDTGWHIDASFGTENPDFMEWRANASSRGRALLMLFLFSDVGPDDAPTRIRCGSQRVIGDRLRAAGEHGLTLRELAADAFAESAGLPEALATGEAGTVYLCHPFLVHAAQRHRGREPRFLAQPPLLPLGRDAIAYNGPGLLPLARAVSGDADPRAR